MELQNAYINLITPSQNDSQSVFREGSTVFIRIIEQTGQNSYIAGSTAGRFQVTSNTPLEIGTTLLAKISLVDGKVVLTPEAHEASQSQFLETYNLSGKISSEIIGKTELSGEMAAYFVSLGLTPDVTTLRLFQQMKMLGMKFDAQLLRNAWRIAQKFPGKEQEAAEAALILGQKGLGVSVENVSALLGFLPFGASDDKKREQKDERQNGEQQEQERDFSGDENETYSTSQKIPHSENTAYSEIVLPSELKRFFTSLLSGENAAPSRATENAAPSQQNPSSQQNQPSQKIAFSQSPGILSLFNTIDTSAKDAGNWILLPFDFSVENAESEVNSRETDINRKNAFSESYTGENDTGHGNLRIFYAKNEKKVAISIFFSGKKYDFVLYFKKEKCEKIHFSLLPEIVGKERERCIHQLKTLTGVDVECCSENETTGFCPDDVPISVVRGSV